MFPKTVVLTIDSHGFYAVKDCEYDIQNSGVKLEVNANTTTVNTNTTTDINTNTTIKNVFKINAVFAGVNNVSTQEIRNTTMRKVKKYVRTVGKTKQLNELVLGLRDLLVDCNKEIIPILEKDVANFKRQKGNRDDNDNNKDINSFTNYLRHYDKSYRIEHNILLEKNYIRFQPDEEYNDTLLVLNTERNDEIDLFTIIEGFNIQSFCLSEIIQFLRAFQVENIIILDFSCSGFKDFDTMTNISERSARFIRRNIYKCT
jgi:hypothetical protein